MNTQEYLKYLLSTTEWTPEERKWMLRYLEGNDLSELETVAAVEFNADIDTVKGILDRKLSENILTKIHQQIEPPSETRIPAVPWYRSRIAVAVLIVLLAGTGYYFKDNLDQVFNPVALLEVAVAVGERKTILLPDSSQVTLEPGSKMEYPEKFNGKSRTVKLDGEAFFEITKDAAHPFIISTRFINTTVLGTSFSVQAYGSQEAKVVVVTGRVRVQTTPEGNKQSEIEIVPGQGAVYNKATGELEKREATEDARFYAQRHNGKFIYNGIPMASVVKDMERFYKVSISLKGDVKNCLFNGSVYTSDELDKALLFLTESLNAKVKKDSSSNNYIITGGACH